MHCTHPVYLGVTLDHTLPFKEHIKKHTIETWIPKQHPSQTGQLQMGSHSTHIKIYCSGLVLSLCGVYMPWLAEINPCQETWNLKNQCWTTPVAWTLDSQNPPTQTTCTSLQALPLLISDGKWPVESRWQRLLLMKATSSMEAIL